ncbi:MAG: PEGA domain-containing protein [Myxococcales bacterium]|nr:PEGA domain-containing protein [Myxococcota bacterium]MDW8283002.1 PEGA domain-containing protein [Myxococcales bacterium]
MTRPCTPFVLSVCLLLAGSLSGLAPARAARTAQVTIQSIPAGATVYIDGREQGARGTTSARFRIRLERGPHQLRLELPGYRPLEQTIQVSRNATFTFTLQPAPAILQVRTPAAQDAAQGAEVYVDGSLVGQLPLDKEVDAGRHLVEVRKPGFKVYSESVEVKSGERRPLWVKLEPEQRVGSLLVSADVPQAMVLVDGVPRGTAPVLVEQLAEGEHLVEVRRPEEGAEPWRQQVRVQAGQQVQVLARPGPPKPRGGSLLVVAPEGADVIIDGTQSGKANQVFHDLTPGEHIVDVRVPDREPVTRRVTIEEGRQHVVQVELPKTAAERGVGTLRVILGTPVPGVEFFLNGRRYDESQVLADRGLELPAGRNILVVRREGYAQVRRDIELRAGATKTVTVDLRAEGAVRIRSTPPGAEVLLDGTPVGRTPYFGERVAAGPHRVELRLAGYADHVDQITVRPGEETSLMAEMRIAEQMPASVDPMARFSQSSFSALTIDPGAFSVDIGAGYPYFANLRLSVGAVRYRWFGLDGGVELRTTVYDTNVGLQARTQLLRLGPIALGSNILLALGGGPRDRNSFLFEAGIPLTLVAGRWVRLTARPYLQVYNDRHCPGPDSLQELARRGQRTEIEALVQPEHATDRCTGNGTDPSGMPLPNAIADAIGYNPTTTMLGPPTYDPSNALYQVEGTPVLDRFIGVRFLIQAALEVVLTRNVNLWLLIEGAPFQPERQAFTRKFNLIFPERDLPLYGRAGLSFKY